MKIDINLNDIQTLLMNYAENNGVAEIQVHEEWAVDYRINGQEIFIHRLSHLLKAMRLYKEATKQGDAITAQCGLISACLAAS